MPSRIKVTKNKAFGGQEINPLDPRFVTVTDQRSVTVIIKACLESPPLCTGKKSAGDTPTNNRILKIRNSHGNALFSVKNYFHKRK